MEVLKEELKNERQEEIKEQENLEEKKDNELEKLSQENVKLQEALKAKEEEYKNLFQQFQRLQADFDNFRKRTIKEKDELRERAAQNLIEETLPVLDNFQRAIDSGKQQGEAEKFIEGVEMIYTQFFNILKDNGLEMIDCVGKEFNPEVHQAVSQMEVQDEEDNIVLEEVQKGYLLKGKLLRPSMVIVSKKS